MLFVIGIASIVIMFLIKNTLNGRIGIGHPLLHTSFLFLYGSLIVYTITQPLNAFGKFLSNPVFKHVAKVSYMIYLTHQIFSGMFHMWFFTFYPQMRDLESIGVTLLSLAATFTFATISYKYFEGPILGLGKKYIY